MPQKKSKKILIYFFLFLIIGTLNNKNLSNINLIKIKDITVTGLDSENNLELLRQLDILKINNLFFLSDYKIKEILNSNNLIENYFVFKEYPSKLNVKINKAIYLARIKKFEKYFFLGSNGKLIEVKDIESDLPLLFGNFENEDFFELKKILDKKNFDYNKIENLFFFKSGRWDIQINDGLLIKLPKKNFEKSIDILNSFLEKDKENKITLIDLRQSNQIITNER